MMKINSSTVLALTLVSLSTVSFAGGVPSSYAPSGDKHHTSHGSHNQGRHTQGGHTQGGHTQGGRGSSHKGGHYKNPRTGDPSTHHPRNAT
jgi:Spy/CpxP family protein refolding chaperone